MFTGVNRERSKAFQKQIYTHMGIARDDIAKRDAWIERNVQFYGAPHAAFIFVPDVAENVNMSSPAKAIN